MELFVSLEVAATPLFALDHLRRQTRGAALALGDDWVVTLGLRTQCWVTNDATPTHTNKNKLHCEQAFSFNSWLGTMS